MQSLLLSPKDALFPATSLLHAVCGTGSLCYANSLRNSKLFCLLVLELLSTNIAPSEPQGSYMHGAYEFAERHIKLAVQQAEVEIKGAVNLVQSHQGLDARRIFPAHSDSS
jgi:hypothetical protein